MAGGRRSRRSFRPSASAGRGRGACLRSNSRFGTIERRLENWDSKLDKQIYIPIVLGYFAVITIAYIIYWVHVARSGASARSTCQFQVASHSIFL
jgi:hypothetical protein